MTVIQLRHQKHDNAACGTGRFRLPLLSGLLALSLVAGCGEGGLFGGTNGEDGASATPQSVELVERDVEAPEVFQVTEAGLWDGRPSFSGVWVAHPDVAEPERVIIRNQDNGQFVIGALFRRERENPGPALQVSSDAAAALGLLAGQPTQLNVTALRREEAATPAPDPLGDDPAATTALADAGDISTAPLDSPEAIAGDAVAAVAPTPTAAPAPAASAATASAAPAPAPSGGPGASSLQRPFIQLGIFAIEANAAQLVQRLTARDLPARMIESSSQGSTFWRVIVGPAGSEAQRAAYLEQVKAEGFADAYFTRN